MPPGRIIKHRKIFHFNWVALYLQEPPFFLPEFIVSQCKFLWNKTWKIFKLRLLFLTFWSSKISQFLYQMTFQSLYLCTQMVATLRPDGCHFAPRWLPLCTQMVATLHPDRGFFAQLPPLVFLEAKVPTFFFLILNELHSSAENFTFLMKINYIPYENTLHSLREYTSFS